MSHWQSAAGRSDRRGLDMVRLGKKRADDGCPTPAQGHVQENDWQEREIRTCSGLRGHTGGPCGDGPGWTTGCRRRRTGSPPRRSGSAPRSTALMRERVKSGQRPRTVNERPSPARARLNSLVYMPPPRDISGPGIKSRISDYGLEADLPSPSSTFEIESC
jgi:hypothetical protein